MEAVLYELSFPTESVLDTVITILILTASVFIVPLYFYQ